MEEMKQEGRLIKLKAWLSASGAFFGTRVLGDSC